MVLFELLQLVGFFLDYLRIAYLWHVLIMPLTNRNGIRRSGDEPEASDQGVRRPEEEPSLQERLGGWPFRAYAVVHQELEPREMGRSPGEAVLLPGASRRAAGPRYGGARGLCVIQGCGSP